MKTLAVGLAVIVFMGASVYFVWPHSIGIEEALDESPRMMEKDTTMKDVMQKDAMMEKNEPVSMQKDVMKSDEAAEKKTVVAPSTEVMAKSGTYEPYAPEKLARANDGRVVLFFRAAWCPTCKAVDADIKANAKAIPSNLTILDVNYDTATELKKKYGVTYQHTFVQVDAAGNQVAKWSGSATLMALVTNVK